MKFEEFIFRIVIAFITGLLIGAERELSNKDAGLKTNTLVSLGASIFVLTSLVFKEEEYVDSTRVIGQVVTGIGFLGAGVILHYGTNVKGLSTAATVWCSAAAGSLAAIGRFKEVIVFTLLIVLINVGFGIVKRFINDKITGSEESKE